MKYVIVFLTAFLLMSTNLYAEEIDCSSIEYTNLRISCIAYVKKNINMCHEIVEKSDRDYCFKAVLSKAGKK